MKKSQSSKQKILSIALKEFAAYGFGGARVERIARQAGVNKAMIFYYYSSKQNLYRIIIKNSLLELIPKIQEAIAVSKSPEQFFENLPKVYIQYFVKNQAVMRMIGFELIQDPGNITSVVRDIFTNIPESPPDLLKNKISIWYQKGLISEPNPVHLILNIIPLCIFSILGKPMVEAILDIKIKNNIDFIDKRINSISNLLKKGMLK
jgi:AcrR family transcriptional regulator